MITAAGQDEARWGEVFRRLSALEAALLSCATSIEQNRQWHETYKRIFGVFIDKATSASTNNEKKLSYEYLAILVVGTVEGFSIFGHDVKALLKRSVYG